MPTRTRKHGEKIDTPTARLRLTARAEPHWNKLGTGRALGFRRRTAKGKTGVWVARWAQKDKTQRSMLPTVRQTVLGEDTAFEYAVAITKAQKFFDQCEKELKAALVGSLLENVYTVEEGCRLYVANIRVEKGNEVADRINAQLKSNIYGTEFGGIALPNLAPIHVERWRNGLVTTKRKKNSVNRLFRQFAAAMNYCKSRGVLETDNPWTNVGQFPVSDGRRNSYLTPIQRTLVLAECDRIKGPQDFESDDPKEREWLGRHVSHCTPDLGDFLRGLMFCGSRPGELAKAKVGDLDLRAQVLTLISAKNKNGEAKPRDFVLGEAAALEFFNRMAKDKLPGAYLMTRADGSAWVNAQGRVLRHEWARGLKAAIRNINKKLSANNRIPLDTVAYTARHTVITDMLSEDGMDSPAVESMVGTSAAMIKKNYYKVVVERMKKKLANRRSF